MLFFKFNTTQQMMGDGNTRRHVHLWGSEMKVLPFLGFLTGGGCRAGSSFSGLARTVLHTPRWALYATGTDQNNLFKALAGLF